MARVGFVGTGAIASAMVQALGGQDHSLLVSERSQSRAQALAATYDSVSVADNAGVVAGSDIVILCLPADVARDVLPDLTFREDQTVISVMAGFSLQELAHSCAPATDLAIMIPLPSLPSGVSPIVAFPHSDAIVSLFGKSAQLQFAPSEDALNAHFAATAMLLPIMTQIDVAANWLAAGTDDKPAAERYMSALFASYFKALELDPQMNFETLKAGLSIEGGMNSRLTKSLRDLGVEEKIVATLDQFSDQMRLTSK